MLQLYPSPTTTALLALGLSWLAETGIKNEAILPAFPSHSEVMLGCLLSISPPSGLIGIYNDTVLTGLVSYSYGTVHPQFRIIVVAASSHRPLSTRCGGHHVRYGTLQRNATP